MNHPDIEDYYTDLYAETNEEARKREDEVRDYDVD